MLSTADTVIVFIFGLLIIAIIFFAVMFINNARGRARTTSGDHTRPQSGAEIPIEKDDVANRLDPSGSTPKGTDPRGVDISG